MAIWNKEDFKYHAPISEGNGDKILDWLINVFGPADIRSANGDDLFVHGRWCTSNMRIVNLRNKSDFMEYMLVWG